MSDGHFHYLNGYDYRTVHGITYNPSREEMLKKAAFFARRAYDNAGTYVFNKDSEEIGYYSNSHTTEDGHWLYYVTDVEEYLCLIRSNRPE